jgi:hypothetical protein
MKAASCAALLLNCVVVPVLFAVPQQAQHIEVINVRVCVVGAGFDDSDTLASVEQSAGDNAACGSGAYDDVVQFGVHG